MSRSVYVLKRHFPHRNGFAKFKANNKELIGRC